MRSVRSLTARHDAYRLARPFRIARGVKTVADAVTVEVTQNGLIGRGEGIPYARYGETIEGALAQLASVSSAVNDGARRLDLLTLLPPGAARNALDCALWDLEAKLGGTTVAALIGAPAPGALPSAITLGIDTPEAMADEARAVAAAPIIKIKVDADNPATRIRAVRAAAPAAQLIVDPNESWDRALLTAMLPVCAGEGVALLEQPVSAGDDAWLEGFARSVPLAADEAVHVAGDLAVVARRYDVVNVKLDKAGGLTAALELARATRAAGLGLMTGCMVSSSLSIAPALHIAAMSDFVDLDGPLWLAHDRPGGVRDDGGVLHPPAPGFWG